MKKLTTQLFALVLVIGLTSCSKNNDPFDNGQVNMTTSLATINQTVINLPTEPLEDAEKARILFIR